MWEAGGARPPALLAQRRPFVTVHLAVGAHCLLIWSEVLSLPQWWVIKRDAHACLCQSLLRHSYILLSALNAI